MYGRLYEEMFGVKSTLLLYYRAWGQYAEFDIREGRDQEMVAEGMVNDVPVRRILRIVPDLLRRELEHYYLAQELPVATQNEIDSWNYPEESYGRLIMQ